MTAPRVRVKPVDARGEQHAESLRPGGVRGNVFHRGESTLIVVLYTDRWTLFFDSGENTPIETRAFEGSGAMRIEIDPKSAYAIRNDGAHDLHIFTVGSAKDSEPRVLVEPLTRIAGVDGCRAGWIAMIKDGESIESRLCVSDDDLIALFNSCAVVGIDIPIGLTDDRRFCDHHARSVLGKRASSVFAAPLRSLLHAKDYRDANRISNQLQGCGISKQSFAIVPKVAQIDRILQRRRELRGRVWEVHPEISFMQWNGGVPLESSKRTKEGLSERRALAEAHFGPQPIPKGAREDDVLDALAALWTAERIYEGRARELGDTRVDLTGLPMRIAY